MAKVLWLALFAAFSWQVHAIQLDAAKNLITNFFSDSSENTDTREQTVPSNFECTEDGLYRNPENCSTFISCGNGMAHVLDCPGGLHFSERKNRCEEKCDAHCDRTLACECNWSSCVKEICFLPPKVGRCRGSFHRFYFDPKQSKCRTFVYGGCNGNENNFKSLDKCENKCGNVINPCRLPVDAGSCNEHYPRYYFNYDEGRCQKFTYGGCHGNANNFETKQKCEQRCLSEDDEESFDMSETRNQWKPFEENSQDSTDQDSQQSSQWTSNNKESDEQENNGENNRWRISRWFNKNKESDEQENQDEKNQWNSKKYYDDEDSQQSNQWVSNNKASDEEVNNDENDQLENTEWFSNRKQQESDDQESNSEENLWDSKQFNDDEQSVLEAVDCTRGSLHPNPKNCSTFIQCSNGMPHLMNCPHGLHFSRESERCESKCDAHCDRTLACKCHWPSCGKEICFLPSKTGPCHAHLSRYFYDKRSDNCKKFVYGGCEGNENNFQTISECQHKCDQESQDDQYNSQWVSNRDSGEENKSSQWDRDTENSEEVKNMAGQRQTPSQVCHQPKKPGPCHENLSRYYYDSSSGRCEVFTYGGCDGNRNNFRREDHCIRTCVRDPYNVDEEVSESSWMESKSVPEYCEEPSEPGTCNGNFDRYYYDTESKTCEKFVYGGCGGNKNNFKSERDCVKSCVRDEEEEESSSVDEKQAPNYCEEPSDKGPCRGSFERFYYDPESKCCESFVYGGCKGNKNNFIRKRDCARTCVRESSSYVEEEEESTSDESRKPSFCEQPKEAGPCRMSVERYYYNSRSGECEKFVYGGCKGNRNNFRRKADCTKMCAGEAQQSEEATDYRCPEPQGHFPDYYDCSIYYECRRNIPQPRKCQGGQLFDHVKRECVEDWEAKCLYHCPQRDGKFPLMRICTKYIECTDNKPRLQSCPSHQAFDIMKHECVPEDEARCFRRETAEQAPSRTQDSQENSRWINADKENDEQENNEENYRWNSKKNNDEYCLHQNGQFPYPPECEKFVRCRHGLAELEECPQGKAFDIQKLKCVPSYEATC